MPQVIEFLPAALSGEIRPALADLARICKEIGDGETFRELRTRLRNARLWEPTRPKAVLRLLGVGGRVITRSPFVQKLAATSNDDQVYDAIADRVFELNPLLAKSIYELVAQRAYGKDEIYKHLGSFAYRGVVPSRPDLEVWLQMQLVIGVLRQIGIAMSPGPRFEAFAKRSSHIDVDEFLAEDKPEPDPEIPGVEDDSAAPAAAAAALDTAAIVQQTAPTPSGSPLPAALRHLAAATLAQPRGKGPMVPLSRFAVGPFSDEVLDDTAQRLAAWWSETKVPSQAHRPEDFGFDPEAWVENADEVLYRVAVAAALAFRLDRDRDGIVTAYKALDAAGVLADLYHGTVPADLPMGVDARALMLASLAARRCAEVPDLAASLEQKKSAAEAFAALDSALGRGLFRIELLWILRMLGQLGTVRWDDLPDYTALPYRVVRDTLFRLGFADSPYAPDAQTLATASRSARRAGGTEVADEVLAAFTLAAGCAYDCPHRRTCDFPCRERLE